MALIHILWVFILFCGRLNPIDSKPKQLLQQPASFQVEVCSCGIPTTNIISLVPTNSETS